jgi:hypothetical protein
LGHVLLMRIERTGPEQRIEAQAILCKLAGDLGVDAVTVNGEQQSRTAVIDQQASALAQATPGPAEARDADRCRLPQPLTRPDARYRRALGQPLAASWLRAELLECRLGP